MLCVVERELLIVATGRLAHSTSCCPTVPGKGEMLCQISNFWFDKTAHCSQPSAGRAVADVLPPASMRRCTRAAASSPSLKAVPVKRSRAAT
jgi:phosphoribosylaminoimidazole-succinocarboxamide synthase